VKTEQKKEKSETKEKKKIDVYDVKVERFYLRSRKTWQVKRVKFNTNFGTIYYKPSKKKEAMKEIDGKKLCFENEMMIGIYDLPKIIREVSDQSIENGICKIKAHFRIWKRSVEEGGDYPHMFEEDVNGIEILPLAQKIE